MSNCLVHRGYSKLSCSITLVQTELISYPGILGRTLHARVKVAVLLKYTTPYLAHIRQATYPFMGIQILGLAVPGLELMQLVAGRGMTHPLNGLLVCYKVNIRQFLQVVKEFLKNRETILNKFLKIIGNLIVVSPGMH